MSSKEKVIPFSKSIMSAVILLYFIGAILGSILVVLAAKVNITLGEPIDASMFIAYAAYIGGPTATAIGFYAWKSKAENVLKISKSFKEGSTEVASALAEMGGNQ